MPSTGQTQRTAPRLASRALTSVKTLAPITSTPRVARPKTGTLLSIAVAEARALEVARAVAAETELTVLLPSSRARSPA